MMFTGVVEGIGRVSAIANGDENRTFAIVADKVLDGTEIGDSIAVNGVCLTAVAVASGRVELVAVTETLDRTNLGWLSRDDPVNLERPMAASGRFDGHVVQGHVDGVAVVEDVSLEGASRRVRFGAGAALLRYIVEKGSIAIDGVSLTITAVTTDSFEVVLIPHTLAVTILGSRQVGDRVNVEVDIFAKYVERLLETLP